MNFMQLLQSLDELLFAVMSWLVFFPITLWRTITRPLRMMEYASSELHDRPAKQYEDTLSPPLFLLLVLLLSHAAGLAIGEGENAIVARRTGLAAFIDSDSKLLVLRMILFSVIPLMLAVSLLVGQRQPVTRERLKPPFYAQCYPAGAFALTIAIGGMLVEAHGAYLVAGLAVILVALVAYFAVQVAWFRRHLQRGAFVSAAFASVSIAVGLALAIGVALLLV
jgi:hypothetical protein